MQRQRDGWASIVDVFSGLDGPVKDLVAWIIPKDALSSCFSTQGIT